jgi:hypothetical protein
MVATHGKAKSGDDVDPEPALSGSHKVLRLECEWLRFLVPHLLWDLRVDSPVRRVFEQHGLTINEFLAMDGMEMTYLTVHADDRDISKPGMAQVSVGDEIPLKRYDVSMLQYFWLYTWKYKLKHIADWEDSKWFDSPQEDFDKFRLQNNANAAVMVFVNEQYGDSDSLGNPEPVSSTPQKPRIDPELLIWKKTLASLDSSKYKKFKDDRYWETYKRALRVKLCAQGLDDVLDPKFNPGIDKEKREIFRLKNKFVFSVLDD